MHNAFSYELEYSILMVLFLISFKEINNIHQKRCIKLIKSDSKIIYHFIKDFHFK